PQEPVRHIGGTRRQGWVRKRGGRSRHSATAGAANTLPALLVPASVPRPRGHRPVWPILGRSRTTSRGGYRQADAPRLPEGRPPPWLGLPHAMLPPTQGRRIALIVHSCEPTS